MRPLLLCLAVLCPVGLVSLARPCRYEIDGLSMAPSLRSGDIVGSHWLPQTDRFFGPRRFERWLLTAPDGTRAVKRVVGLKGETISIVDGDLAIDGEVVLTPPTVLGELASPIADCTTGSDGWHRDAPDRIPLDDADFAPDESRRLAPVRDLGLVAVVRPALPIEATIRVGSREVRWRFASPGRYALVAGRLDRHLVAVAWRLPDEPPQTTGRTVFPPHAPAAWQVVEPWADDTVRAAPLGLRLTREGDPVHADQADRMIERCTAWRDVLHRLPASGTAAWRLGPREVFVLGDFPSGSRDSRHWGPLPAASLGHRVEQVESRPALHPR
ncbi:MAG: S26 family signal peptidase [Planctomycetia bacterium]